jgi:DNA-binding PadR family transcriptional regulator
VVTAARSPTIPAGPVRIRSAAYDIMKRLAGDETVKVIHPTLRNWLRERKYITWTAKGERGERDYALTEMGRVVFETAIRVVS